MSQYIACGTLDLAGERPLLIVSAVRLTSFNLAVRAQSLVPEYLRQRLMFASTTAAVEIHDALHRFFSATMTREQIALAREKNAWMIIPLPRGITEPERVVDLVKAALASLGAEDLPFDVLIPDRTSAEVSPTWVVSKRCRLAPGYLVIRDVRLEILRISERGKNSESIGLNPMLESETASEGDSLPIRIIDQALHGEDREQIEEMCRALAKSRRRLIVIAPSAIRADNISFLGSLIANWLSSIGLSQVKFEILAWD